MAEKECKAYTVFTAEQRAAIEIYPSKHGDAAIMHFNQLIKYA